MRVLISALVAALVLIPAASAEIMTAGGASTAGGMRFSWDATYDTTLNDLTFDCVLVDASTGLPVPITQTMEALVEVTLANNQVRRLDCLPIMNLGPQFDGNVNLKIDTIGRWSGFTIHTAFRP